MRTAFPSLALVGTLSLTPVPQEDARSSASSCPAAVSISVGASGNSIRCLVCHDGTIAKNAFPTSGNDAGSASRSGHPVLVSYADAHFKKPGAFVAPAALDPKLVLIDGKIQCVTCHSVSADQAWTTVALMGRRDLCLGCHQK